MKPPSMAPAYIFLYPALAELARSYGYALAVHGSIGKDFDLIAIPWVEKPAAPDALIHEIRRTYAVASCTGPHKKPHGRIVYTIGLTISGECYLDFSFMPRIPAHEEGRP